MMKHIFPIALVIVAGILGGVYLAKGPEPKSLPSPEISEAAESAATSSADATPDSPKTSPADSAPAKPPASTPPPASSGYTMAQVAAHAGASSCWTAIGGKVYDLTSWISKHPGGKSAILRLCGVDGTAAFDDQHGGQARPERELASFLIGTLAS